MNEDAPQDATSTLLDRELFLAGWTHRSMRAQMRALIRRIAPKNRDLDSIEDPRKLVNMLNRRFDTAVSIRARLAHAERVNLGIFADAVIIGHDLRPEPTDVHWLRVTACEGSLVPVWFIDFVDEVDEAASAFALDATELHRRKVAGITPMRLIDEILPNMHQSDWLKPAVGRLADIVRAKYRVR